MKPANVIIGAFFILFGLVQLNEEFEWLDIQWNDISRFWPLALIGYGVWVLVRNRPEFKQDDGFLAEPQKPVSTENLTNVVEENPEKP